METKHTPQLLVCHQRPGDAYEIQTDETPRRLVAVLFHRDDGNKARLSTEEAAVYASLFAAAPETKRQRDALLEACKYVVKWHREHDSGEGELFGLDFVTTCIGAIALAEKKD